MKIAENCCMLLLYLSLIHIYTKKGFSAKEIREINPDNNKGLYVVPQILSNQAEDTVNTIHKLERCV